VDATTPGRSTAAGLDAAVALGDPLRRRLLDFVTEALDPISRDDAAAAIGIGRSLAGYHLDHLVEHRLLTVTYARRTGRVGPGAGRPAKLYERAPVEISVQLPARDDVLVAHLLAGAVEADRSGEARRALRKGTKAAGRALGRTIEGTGDVLRALTDRGYAPLETSEGIRLRNCPFHHLVGDHLELVCALNKELLGTAVKEADVSLIAELDPQPGRCCVVLRPPPRDVSR
jgi:predicted ArsR family transcriptional regulator